MLDLRLYPELYSTVSGSMNWISQGRRLRGGPRCESKQKPWETGPGVSQETRFMRFKLNELGISETVFKLVVQWSQIKELVCDGSSASPNQRSSRSIHRLKLIQIHVLILKLL